MSSAKKASPGKALVESLTRQLAANMEFDETETNTLDLTGRPRYGHDSTCW